MLVWILVYILGAYLLGSISSAVLVTRLFMNTDIRQQGSGNAGATNVLRIAGKKAAALVFVFDVFKGAIPVYLGFLAGFGPFALSAIAVGACIGHMYPVFFSFKGGKGVATALGAIMPLNWLLCLAVLGTWLVVFILTRISSIAAIITLVLAPIYTFFIKPEYSIAVGLLCLLIVLKHKSNIMRLLDKNENSFANAKSASTNSKDVNQKDKKSEQD